MTARRVVRLVTLAAAASLLEPPPACADWTLAAFFGGADTRDTSLTLSRPAESTDVALSPIRYRSESLVPPIYYGYRVAFFPRSGWLGIEGELIHLKAIAVTERDTRIHGSLRGERVSGTVRVASVIEQFSISHGVNLLLVNVVLRRPLIVGPARDSRWTLAARLGAGASVPHPESTIDGRHAEGYEWGALSLQAAAGAQLRLRGRLSVLGEYKLTRSIQDVTVAEGTARTPLTTQHLVAGLAVRLGGGP